MFALLEFSADCDFIRGGEEGWHGALEAFPEAIAAAVFVDAVGGTLVEGGDGLGDEESMDRSEGQESGQCSDWDRRAFHCDGSVRRWD